MRKKRKSAASANQLELPFVTQAPAAPVPADGLWPAVEAFPGKVERYNRERKKLVRKKMHQVDVELLLGPRLPTPEEISADLLAQGPSLTQAQADVLDDLVVQEDCSK